MLEQIKALLWKNWTIYKRNFKKRSLDAVSVVLYVLYVWFHKPEIVEVAATSSPPKLFNPHMTLMSKMRLPYVPKSPATDNLMRLLTSMSGVGETIAFQDWETADESLSSDENSSERFPLACFTNVESNATTMPVNLSVSMGIYQLSETGYVTPLNILIATAFINYHRHHDGLEPLTFEISSQPFPTPAGKLKKFSSLDKFLSFIIIIFFTIFLYLCTCIATDKQQKLKEVMALMGVSTGIYWISWFITGFIMTFPIVAIVTTEFSIDAGEGPVIGSTNPVVFYIWIQVYVINIMSISYLIASQCRKVEHVNMAVPTILLISPYVVLFIINLKIKNRPLELLFNILLFQHAFFVGKEPFLIMAQGDGYGFTNLMTRVSKDGDTGFSLFDSILGMILNTVLHIFLMWYIDNIFPGEYGIPQAYDFFLKPSYWRSEPTLAKNTDIELPPQDELYFEQEPEDLEVGIQTLNLVKVFDNKVAVGGVNMKIYKNQITVLLGHNGAGKTTTLDMIAGFLPPSKGTSIVNGYDMKKQSYQARKCIGLCPQHDILYDLLTCTEHMQFYLSLRGETTEVKSTCLNLLTQVELQFAQDTVAEKLSGGQKRKLSLAIALVGSQVVILDEPSAGMDPSARHGMWQVLQSIRGDRTLLMTTHYMDEAEALGDRIAIMAGGVVKCCGSPLFLKHLYGTGYQLNIVTLPSCKPDKVTTFLQKIVPGIQYLGSSHTELYFMLLEEDLKLFSELFQQLEGNLKDLGISTFGVDATTMEEVFLKVGEGFEPKADRLRKTADDSEHIVNVEAVTIPYSSKTQMASTNQRFQRRAHAKQGNEAENATVKGNVHQKISPRDTAMESKFYGFVRIPSFLPHLR